MAALAAPVSDPERSAAAPQRPPAAPGPGPPPAAAVVAGMPPVAAGPAIAARDADAAARRALREQIARLERELATVVASTYPRVAPPPGPAAGGAPRLLDLAALERSRDALAARVSGAHRAAAEQTARQAAARERLQAMLADPPAHKGERIANRALGLPGCTTYAVLPRLGPVGLLTGWWRVKVSSGCP